MQTAPSSRCRYSLPQSGLYKPSQPRHLIPKEGILQDAAPAALRALGVHGARHVSSLKPERPAAEQHLLAVTGYENQSTSFEMQIPPKTKGEVSKTVTHIVSMQYISFLTSEFTSHMAAIGTIDKDPPKVVAYTSGEPHHILLAFDIDFKSSEKDVSQSERESAIYRNAVATALEKEMQHEERSDVHSLGLGTSPSWAEERLQVSLSSATLLRCVISLRGGGGDQTSSPWRHDIEILHKVLASSVFLSQLEGQLKGHCVPTGVKHIQARLPDGRIAWGPRDAAGEPNEPAEEACDVQHNVLHRSGKGAQTFEHWEVEVIFTFLGGALCACLVMCAMWSVQKQRHSEHDEGRWNDRDIDAFPLLPQSAL